MSECNEIAAIETLISFRLIKRTRFRISGRKAETPMETDERRTGEAVH